MEIYLLWSALLLIILMPAVLLTFAIHRNSSQAERYYQEVNERLGKSNLGRMLLRHRVELNEYSHRNRTLDLYRRMLHCERCDHIGPCEDYLAGHSKSSPHSFCPNADQFPPISSTAERADQD